MPTAHASSTSSIKGEGKTNVDTMTSGDNGSAAAKSTDKDDESFFETSETITDKDGNTHTTKTSGIRDASEQQKIQTPLKEVSAQDKCNKVDKADGEETIFAKAGDVFAAAGGAIAGVKDGKAVATAI